MMAQPKEQDREEGKKWCQIYLCGERFGLALWRKKMQPARRNGEDMGG
jgi:hypothetical protein